MAETEWIPFALALLEAFPVEHLLVAQIYHELQAIYRKLGRYQEVLETAEKAVKIRRVLISAEHSDLAVSYNGLGWLGIL